MSEERIDLMLRVQDWAQREAEKDLRFCGDAPWAHLGLTKEQRKAVEAALVQYARAAAARTVTSLRLHGIPELSEALRDLTKKGEQQGEQQATVRCSACGKIIKNVRFLGTLHLCS